MALEQSNEDCMPARKSHSKERIARTPAIIERAQTLISDDDCPGQSLQKLTSIVGISESTMYRITEEDLHYKSLKIRQMRPEVVRNKLSCSHSDPPTTQI